MKKTGTPKRRTQDPIKTPGAKRPERPEMPNTPTVFDPWIDYSKRMESQITGVLKDSRNEYEKMYNGWKDFSKSMTMRLKPPMNEEAEEKGYTEMFNVWKNYSNKIGVRLENIVERNTTNIRALTDMYQDFVMNSMKNTPMMEGTEKNTLQDIYTSWFDFSNTINTQFARLVSLPNENEKVVELWNDLTDKMTKITDTMVTENEVHTNEINAMWNTMSDRFGDSMMEFFDGRKNDYENVYGTWLKETEKMGARLTNTMQASGTDYEGLYKMYFERMAGFQKGWTMFPFFGPQKVRDEVADLNKKVADLEKKLDEQKD